MKSKLYGFFYALVTSVTFNFLIYCIILANTITLALFRFDQSEAQTEALAICDVIFVAIFTAEMLCKLLGLGVKNYVRDKFNLFDGCIVIIGAVDFTLFQVIDGIESDSDGIMSALRALRLLRVIKLARHWKALQEILHTIKSSIVDISNFSVLLLLVLYIFALLGMELFAYSAFYDTDGNVVFGKDKIQQEFSKNGLEQMQWPRENFNSIGNAMVTVFVIIVAEDWNIVMYTYVRALEASSVGRNLAIAYFIGLFIIGNIMMLALFTALLLKRQNKDTIKLEDKLKKESKETLDPEPYFKEF